MSKVRFKPNVVYRKESPNRYSPRGSKIKLIVLHSTESHNREGASDLRAIADFFSRSGTEASSHVVTDADGNSARCVPDHDAAWTQGWANRVSLSVEQVGQAAQTKWADAEVKETARWIARWSHRHGVPIRKAWTVGERVLRSGVTMHRKISGPGGHTDPGEHFPMKECLDHARRFKKLLVAST